MHFAYFFEFLNAIFVRFRSFWYHWIDSKKHLLIFFIFIFILFVRSFKRFQKLTLQYIIKYHLFFSTSFTIKFYIIVFLLIRLILAQSSHVQLLHIQHSIQRASSSRSDHFLLHDRKHLFFVFFFGTMPSVAEGFLPSIFLVFRT